MSQVLTLELNDKIYAALQQQAEESGISVSEVIAFSLERQYGSKEKNQRTEAEKEATRQRFEKHFGAINLGYPTDIDNESIDADLTREYANNHEED